MRKTKDIIYEYIQKEIHTNRNMVNGIDTQTIAESLHMQRSNVSALLNLLVKEGKLDKTETRPVLYTLPKEKADFSSKDSFKKLIGHNGSLRKAVQLAKAAILYPPCGLPVLLLAQSGCGITLFTETMFQFAQEKGIVPKDSPFININCKHYLQNTDALNDELFGSSGDLSKSCFFRAKRGMLFIDNVDVLEAKQLSRIFDFLDTGKLYTEDRLGYQDCDNILLILACSPQNSGFLSQRIPVVIELPELRQRPLQERFDLIHHFFLTETVNAGRCIEVDPGVAKALLTTNLPYNVKELSLEIKAACANAYVRVVNDQQQDIYVCLNDFKNQAHKGLMLPKEEEARISALLNIGNILFYDLPSAGQKEEEYSGNIYAEVRKQYHDLLEQGIHSSRIENVINMYIQNLFRHL